MAQKTIIELIDDLDGGPATQTLTFAFRGTTYEIDLSDAHVAELETALEKFIASGRKVGGSSRAHTSTPTDVALNAVRAWAAANGIDVAARGRVAADVIKKFRDAGN